CIDRRRLPCAFGHGPAAGGRRPDCGKMPHRFRQSGPRQTDVPAISDWPHGLQSPFLMADSEGSHAPRSPFRVWHAFIWSMKGLRATWNVESSFRLEVYLFVVLAPLAVWLGKDGIERSILIGSMLLVLVIEVLNSAVEAVVDRWGPEHHQLAGRAKDMGSAAVFLSDMNVLLCWGLLLG